MNTVTTFELNDTEMDRINGGLVCGGLCVLGAIVAGVGLLSGGVTLGAALR